MSATERWDPNVRKSQIGERPNARVLSTKGHSMTLVEYSLTAFVVLNSLRAVAYFPQIIRVYRDPHGAAAVSLSTWALFSAANVATAWYALAAYDDRLTAFLFAINALGCMGIVVLTAMKRMTARPAEIQPDTPQSETDVFWAWSRR